MGGLPLIRQELGLSRAPAGYDGEPLWTLHDPATNRFYQIGWPVFEIPSRWRMRGREALVEAVNSETTLRISASDVDDVSRFLASHNLLVASGAEDSERLDIAARRARPSPLRWLLHNYLFFRVPLIRPMPLLRLLYPAVAFVYRPAFLFIMAILVLLGLFLVSRQWDNFTHTFSSYFSVEGVLAFAIALAFA